MKCNNNVTLNNNQSINHVSLLFPLQRLKKWVSWMCYQLLVLYNTVNNISVI